MCVPICLKLDTALVANAVRRRPTLTIAIALPGVEPAGLFSLCQAKQALAQQCFQQG
jgi:hypothetical protein